MYRRCREAGINFFDCANVYAGGRSEEILGRLVKPERDEIILTTKVNFATGEDRNARGLSRRHIMQAVEQSLKRLDTDRIDVYFCHSFDKNTPIEETLHAFDDLVRQGKVLYPAVSNWAAWQIAKALGISERKNFSRFECIQPMYNLTKRQVEVEILPLARSEEIGVISYSPLGGGLLSGKYNARQRPEGGRLVDNKLYKERYGDPAYFEIAERFTRYAEEHGVHPATLAVAWVKAHPAVTAPIIGGRSVEQLEPSLKAAEFEMSREQREEIAALSVQPPPATDRSEEQKGLSY
jgi:aryl-alcohol dehydrogenase-like predicted oxidoreductase